MSARQWIGTGVDQDVVDIARGLYESRVIVKRPPSAAQRGAYRTSYRGPPNRPFSAKGRISSEKQDRGVPYAQPLLPRPPWRPFSGQDSLSKSYVSHNSAKSSSASEKEDEKEEDEERIPEVYRNRALPQSLVPLKEWLTDGTPSDWAMGYSPESNFVFLPCLKSLGEESKLAPVPPPQDPTDYLAYTPPQPQKYRPPKPKLKIFTGQEDLLKNSTKSGSNTVDASKPSHLRMYSNNGELIHDIYHGKQSAEIIRQEIQDLERLLQGIGNPDGASIVVRYQHDINHLRDMVKTTLKGYTFPDESRSLTPVAAALQEDLVRYPERIDEILSTIKQRRDDCVKELAALEKEILPNKK